MTDFVCALPKNPGETIRFQLGGVKTIDSLTSESI
jgi:hypothetical protein